MTVVWADNGEPGVRWQAYTKVRHSKESTRSAHQIWKKTAVCEQELGDCIQSKAISSKMMVIWADHREPGLREKASTKVRHSKELTRSSTQIRNMTVLCEQELVECSQLEALSSDMTVLWADNMRAWCDKHMQWIICKLSKVNKQLTSSGVASSQAPLRRPCCYWCLPGRGR